MILIIFHILVFIIAYWFSSLFFLGLGSRLEFGYLARRQWFKRVLRVIATVYLFPALIFTVTGFLLVGRMAFLVTGNDRGFETKFPFGPKPWIEDIWE